MTGVLNKRKRQQGCVHPEERLYEDIVRRWPSSIKEGELKRTQIWWYLDFRLLASRTIRECISVILRCQVYGNLSQHPPKTNIELCQRHFFVFHFHFACTFSFLSISCRFAASNQHTIYLSLSLGFSVAICGTSVQTPS